MKVRVGDYVKFTFPGNANSGYFHGRIVNTNPKEGCLELEGFDYIVEGKYYTGPISKKDIKRIYKEKYKKIGALFTSKWYNKLVKEMEKLLNNEE